MREFSSVQQIERGETAIANPAICEVNGLAIIISESAKEVVVAPNAKHSEGQEQRVKTKSTLAAAS
jgi:hypothetical protein